jgi:hypothetical protein
MMAFRDACPTESLLLQGVLRVPLQIALQIDRQTGLSTSSSQTASSPSKQVNLAQTVEHLPPRQAPSHVGSVERGAGGRWNLGHGDDHVSVAYGLSCPLAGTEVLALLAGGEAGG